MAISQFKVVLHRDEMRAEFQSTGEIGRANRRWAEVASEVASDLAPKRTHNLANSFYVTQGRSPGGQFASMWVLANSAYYAGWVSGGTDVITATSSRYGMAVPKRKRMDGLRGAALPKGQRFWTQVVSGQSPNNFFEQAVIRSGKVFPAFPG